MSDDAPQSREFYLAALAKSFEESREARRALPEPELHRQEPVTLGVTPGDEVSAADAQRGEGDAPAPSIAAASPDFSLYVAGSALLGIRNGTLSDGFSFAGLPDVMTVGGIPACTFAISVDGFAWIKTTVDTDSSITAVTIEVGASVPLDSPTEAYEPLGEYGLVAGGLFISSGAVGIGSQRFKSCGGFHDYFSG